MRDGRVINVRFRYTHRIGSDGPARFSEIRLDADPQQTVAIGDVRAVRSPIGLPAEQREHLVRVLAKFAYGTLCYWAIREARLADDALARLLANEGFVDLRRFIFDGDTARVDRKFRLIQPHTEEPLASLRSRVNIVDHPFHAIRMRAHPDGWLTFDGVVYSHYTWGIVLKIDDPVIPTELDYLIQNELTEFPLSEPGRDLSWANEYLVAAVNPEFVGSPPPSPAEWQNRFGPLPMTMWIDSVRGHD